LLRIKKDLTQKEIEEKVEEALENVGLTDAINKMPSQLSGGMRSASAWHEPLLLTPDHVV